MSAKADPDALALRARPRPVTRLNRRMLIGTIVAMVCLVLGVTVWSLRPSLRLSDVRPELHNVDRIARAEGIDRLPPDYSKLVPPKPGARRSDPRQTAARRPGHGDVPCRARKQPDPGLAPPTPRRTDAQRAERRPRARGRGRREGPALLSPEQSEAARQQIPATAADASASEPGRPIPAKPTARPPILNVAVKASCFPQR